MVPYAFGFIWVQTPYVSEVMELMPEIKGIAASLLTSARLLITAGVVGLSGLLYDGTIIPLTFLLIAISTLVGIFMFFHEFYISAKSINPSKGST